MKLATCWMIGTMKLTAGQNRYEKEFDAVQDVFELQVGLVPYEIQGGGIDSRGRET